MKKIISVVGARPNFIKVAPLHKAFLKYNDQVKHLICHTGQHFDEKMSKVFFEELQLPEPDFYLGTGGGSHAEQTAKIMIAFEEVLIKEKPELVIVVGDVNSTLACSVTAAKLCIPVAHVEAGLRSFDRTMPEEINRMVTDVISDFLFITEKSGLQNLKNEGISNEKVFFTGNVMIDSLVQFLPQISASQKVKSLNLTEKDYILCTFHRPANVDTAEGLKELIGLLNFLSAHKTIVFPVHPRTRNNMQKFGLLESLAPSIIISDPIGYIEFLSLTKEAFMVITDSGGIQEETTYLGVQCITVRDNTERPVTVDVGTNQLIGTNMEAVKSAALEIILGKVKKGAIPELWDGKAAERITSIIIEKLNL